MGLEYLNSANSGGYVTGAARDESSEQLRRLRQVRALLLELPTSGDAKLSQKDRAKAYALILELVIGVTPLPGRLNAMRNLALSTPRCFHAVIEEIARNCV